MDSLFWNVRGSNGAMKQLELSRFIKAHKFSFVSLMETKLDIEGHQVLKRKLRFHNSSFLSAEGRLCLFWNSALVDVSILEHSPQHIHCSIFCKQTSRIFFVTSVYASNLYAERLMLWKIITQISTKVNGSPWIVGGDYNEVRYSSEKFGGRPVHQRRLRKFNSCIEESGLFDLKAYGQTLSWNNRQDSRIMCRLDRVLVNASFTNSYPHSLVHYLAPGISDHSPMQVSYEPAFPTGPKPFKYFEMWEHSDHRSYKGGATWD
ncbi:hypothetical protein QJS10_CPB04g00904 [Acorus calamus]|uniref:Endonuclease/exonuclease/phosphatase domain-containing protein n=1 Tax=Acorus calamus TaxID=4465 RepID=A0AAV9EYN9_ACOCL|nr:hypothetical protein QJS10_CPB04g00904 [Acorus calamus]